MSKSFLARLFAALTEKEISELELLLLERRAQVAGEKPKATVIEHGFEFIYRHYPRKLGKASGIKKLKRQRLSEAQYNLLMEATQNYAAFCKKHGTEQKFIMHFSTFAMRWEDWTSESMDKTQQSCNLVPSFSDVFK